MQIVQTVFGVFHHFELARELEHRGHLRRVYSTWPWARLKREGIARSKVSTFPWLHVPEYLAARAPIDLTWLRDHLGYANAVAFDRWTESQLTQSMRREGRGAHSQGKGAHSQGKIDALIGISGSSLRAGELIQRNGGVFICDRGSTHQRYQEQILADEFSRWGVGTPPSDPRDTRREEAIYAACDAITVPSTMAARSFAEMGVPRDKVHVIPYGVRLESFQLTGEPPADTFDVLFAGSVGLRKGVPYLLEAFANLRHPRKRLRIVGSVQEDIRSVLPRLPMENVEMLGSIPQSDLAALMSRSHVLALPSIEEGLALVQAQAMACGCPVVCSTNTGGEDLFTDGIEGFIVPIRDPDALAGRLQRLADDASLQRSMRVAALRRVRSIGGWKEYGDRWERLLQTLTSSVS
jgi:alpha-maltose-1-phosphate synthase